MRAPSWRLLGPCLLLAGWTSGASAQIVGSPDVTIDLSGTLVRPADAATDVEVLLPGLVDLGPMVDGAEVIAYAPWAGTGELFTVGHTLSLPGGVTARPRDVVLWDGNAYSVALDGATAGFPDGVAIDALAFDPATGSVWLSFDTTVDLSGTLMRDADVFDENLVRVFDASAAGIPAGIDVDAVSMVPGSSDVLLSFDVGGTIAGVDYADEDVLRYDGNTWSLELDASVSDPDWVAADLDAIHYLPEPGTTAMLLAGAAPLLALSRRRSRATRRRPCPVAVPCCPLPAC